MEDARSQHTRSSFRGVGSRATNELRGNRPERKKSAAERLEADKIKYVKSAHVREKRITAASISPHNDSTGTYSMSSTGSPTRIDDDEDDQPAAAGGGESRLPLAQSLPLPVPQVEATGKPRSRPPVAKPRQASHNEVVVVDQSPLMSKSYQSKSMSNKFYDCVYKAKESLRPVVQTIRFDEMTTTITTTTTTSQENPPPRQSRTSSRSTKPRSASVGPNVRTTHHERFYEQQLTKSKAGLISPRTQLKQARDGLKKVKDDHRFGVRSARPNQLDVEGATFHQNATVAGVKDSRAADGDQDGKQPPQQQHRSKPLAIIENNIVLSCTAPKQRSDTMPMKAFAPSPAINRKAAAMEANAAAEMESAESTRRGKHNKIMYANGGGCTKRSPKEDSTAGTTTTTTEVASNNSQAKRAQVPKLMSPSAYHHQQQQQQQQHNIISCGGGGTNELLVRNILPNTPRQRRSWSKNPNEASAASRKHHHHHNSRRAAIQQEGNRPGSRKSISERLGEILTPLEDMDTVNMPPPPMATRTTTACYENTPTESNTVIAHNNQTTAITAESPTPAVVSVSNNAAGQTVYGRVDQAPSARGATTATADDYKSFPSSSNSAGASGRSFNKSNNVGPPQSPSLAPRTRREVAPTDKKRSSEHHHHHHHDKHTTTTTNSSGDDIRAQSTLQSHNTSSSAATSADVSKPLTALTASDLKPRRTKRNTTSSAVTPLRAAHPYPPYNGHADKLRRQTAVAAPPTQSPLRPPSSSSRRNSYHQQHRGSNAAVILLQDSKSEAAKLNNFFATMGGYMPSHSSNENICFNIDCESDFSFAGASAYVREDDECNMEVEMKPGAPYQAPSVSIIEKHARIMQWIMSCRSQMNQQQQQQSSNHLSCFVAPKESSV